MPIRNPFKKAGPTALEPAQDENDRPSSRSGSEQGFERQSVAGSTKSAPLSIKGVEPDEYKLCVVNDSGVYLPDISARSPVAQYDVTPPRKSLDSRAMRLARSTANGRRAEREPPTEEELFEDVGLNDDPKPKKKGLFSHFGNAPDAAGSSNSTHHGFHFTSRKRGHSGQGAELGKIEKPSGTVEANADK